MLLHYVKSKIAYKLRRKQQFLLRGTLKLYPIPVYCSRSNIAVTLSVLFRLILYKYIFITLCLSLVLSVLEAKI